MFTGLCFALAARKYGVEKLRTEVVNAEGSDLKIGSWWNFVVAVIVPIEAIALMVWWFWDARKAAPESWLDPFQSGSVGTVMVQWALALVAIFFVQRWYRSRISTADESSGAESG